VSFDSGDGVAMRSLAREKCSGRLPRTPVSPYICSIASYDPLVLQAWDATYSSKYVELLPEMS
jgi:hypothetical protein